MMVIVLLTIWTTGIVLIITDRKNPSSRWAGITSLIGGFGFLAGVLDDELRPLMPPNMGDPIHIASNAASFICQVGLPYAFLLFSLHASPFLSENWQRVALFLGPAPILYTVFTTPVFPELSMDYQRLSLWAIIYILLGVSLLFYGLIQERDPLLRRSRLVVIVIGVIPMLFVMITIYIMRLFGWFDIWKYNAFVLLIQFLFFIGFSLKYGVLGFKLRVEHNRLNSTMRALTSGTTILNHTIKNEIGKMQLLIHLMERREAEHPDSEMKRNIQELYQSTVHILDMVHRIQGKIRDIELHESLVAVHHFITAAVPQVPPQKQIEFVLELETSEYLWMDAVHVHEVLVNVLNNAVEAIPIQGEIRIRTYLSRKYFTVMVEDNGKGIAKENLPHIFEPFYSTKKNQSTNFGLGLAYCYQVMRTHQGFMEVQSTQGKGTLVFLYFPRARLREVPAQEGVKKVAAYSSNDGRR